MVVTIQHKIKRHVTKEYYKRVTFCKNISMSCKKKNVEGLYQV